MKAAYINQTGAPEVITCGELPTPKPTRRQCLIRVAAVDVNPIDVYIRNGAIPAKLSFPFILGRDLAGTVAEIGASVKQFKVGDRVWASNQGVARAARNFCRVRRGGLKAGFIPFPKAISGGQAAPFPWSGITAQLGLVRHANLRAAGRCFS